MLLTIRTERLTLRPFNESDARRIAYLAGDYDVARMCGRVPHPYPVAAAYSWIDRHENDRQKGGEFAFAVTAPFDGLIGSIGVNRTGDPADAAWELGYWLGMPYWGFGYASEAGRALMDWARDQLGAKVFAAGHFVDNPASGNVLRKLGFVHTGSAELFGLARQQVSPCERYVWPEGAAPVSLHSHHHPH
jgi:ribosomal-protein-alanine N-acetyltransferase